MKYLDQLFETLLLKTTCEGQVTDLVVLQELRMLNICYEFL